MTPLPSPRAALTALAVLAAGLSAACSPDAPAAYQRPEPGTVLHYQGLTNTVTAVDGWRTRFVDNHGREGQRLALFITDDPRQPAQVDPGELEGLWPLEVGKEKSLAVRYGREVWRWEFRVVGTEDVAVPAGTFRTLVVQAVQSPELVHSPQTASAAMHTWWYAPELGSVVRFRTSYLTGPATGRVVESALERVVLPTPGAPAAAP